MAENDEYYGSEKARSAYDGLQAAYSEKGYTDEQINERLVAEIPDNEYFNSRGIYNYHGGGTILFDDENIILGMKDEDCGIFEDVLMFLQRHPNLEK